MNPDAVAQFASTLTSFVNTHVPTTHDATGGATSIPRRRCNTELLKRLLTIDPTLHPHDLTAMQTLLVRTVCPQNVTCLTMLVNQVLLLVAPNVHTRDTFMSATRKRVRTRVGEHSAVWHDMCRSLILQPKSRLCKRRLAHSRLVDKNANQMSVNFDDVHTAVKLMNSGTDLMQHIGLLQLCCGARLVEILHVSQFSAIPDHQHRILLVGTAKSRTVKTFTRPLLFLDSTRFMELVNSVQTHVAGVCRRLNLTTRDQISKHFNKSLLVSPDLASRCFGGFNWLVRYYIITVLHVLPVVRPRIACIFFTFNQ
jgi:hypothetical protein